MIRKSGKIRQRRILNEIELLSGCGAGLHAIASPFCGAVRELLSCRSTMLIWFDKDERPIGFFHDSAPAELKDLFIANLDAAFTKSETVNAMSTARPEGPLVGKTFDSRVRALLYSTNIRRHFCAPLGYHHVIYIRAQAPENGLAVFFAWNDEARPFTTQHTDLLEQIQPLMQRALALGTQEGQWRSLAKGNPHFITCMDGCRLIAIDDEAQDILIGSHLFRQEEQMPKRARHTPGFARLLSQQLETADGAAIVLPVPDGRLVCRAKPTKLIRDSGSDEAGVFVSIDLQQWDGVARIRHLMGLALTPLQRRIALFAMQAGERSDCATRFGISHAAVKEHTKTIYGEVGVHGWRELARWMPA